MLTKNLLPLLLLSIVVAAPAAAIGSEKGMESTYFSKSPRLSPQEKEAIGLAEKWQAEAGTQIVAGEHGSVQFVFGAKTPDVVCAVLQVCDIALQAGEQVNSIQVGDAARWNIEPAVSGSGAQETQHLLIKPLDAGLVTSLVVATDRRTYHVRLTSHRTLYMAAVTFVYPEEALAKWQGMHRHETAERQEKTIPQTGEYLGNLAFDYDISGEARWKPVRVYNDGQKTIIQMPSTLSQSEAPTLLIVRKDEGTFHKAQTEMVNYRVQNDRYIVDEVFDKAYLIVGVGDDQERVTIAKRK